MSNIWGKNIRLSIFGESHGKAVGITIDGLPPGQELDLEQIRREMERRAPGRSEFATSRREDDDFEILSGVFQGKTTGTPLCAVIGNRDRRSGDYEKTRHLLRPGHADYTGLVKYLGFNDYRGGGHFSGRLTAPLVLAGALAKQFLGRWNIVIAGFIKSIADVSAHPPDPLKTDPADFLRVSKKNFPVFDDQRGEKMQEVIAKAREEQDSVGGVVETVVFNLPPGLGNPFFDSLESLLAHLLFSIPAVKGVEFGAGFEISKIRGSEANDPFYLEGDRVMTSTNHSGGILGGITNGMPVVFRTAFKPTPSIGRVQNTVDLAEKKNTTMQISGRHDPCIVPRAVPVTEAAAALVFLDLILGWEKENVHGESGKIKRRN